MDGNIVWKNPPESTSKVRRVMDQLKSKPGEWAMIESETGSFEMFPWWGPIYDDKENYEIRYHKKESRLLSPRDIYARYIGGAK